jgi:hypothetical protein
MFLTTEARGSYCYLFGANIFLLFNLESSSLVLRTGRGLLNGLGGHWIRCSSANSRFVVFARATKDKEIERKTGT